MESNKLREIRESRGMSQTRLAITAELAQGCLSNLENGKLAPWPKVRKALSKALKVRPDELFPDYKGGVHGTARR